MRGYPAPEWVLQLLLSKCSRRCKLPERQCMSNGLKCTNLRRLQTCDNQPQEEHLDTMITATDPIAYDSGTDYWTGGIVLRSTTDWSFVLHIICDLRPGSLVNLNGAYNRCVVLARKGWSRRHTNDSKTEGRNGWLVLRSDPHTFKDW